MKRAATKRDIGNAAPVRNEAVRTAREIVGAGLDGETSAGGVHPKWARHYRVLLKVRDRLLKALSERLADAAEPLEPHSINMADSATDEFDHEFAVSELSVEQDALYEVDEALRRIVDGTYGICEDTGRPIPAARLKAIPWARFSREVEAQLERKGVVNRPHLAALQSVRGAATGNLEDSEPDEEHPSSAPEEEALHLVRRSELPKPPRKAGRKKTNSC